MIDSDKYEHATQRVNQALDGSGNRRLENRPRGVGDGRIDVSQEHERTGPQRGVLQRALGRLKGVDAGDGLAHDATQPGDRRVGIGAGLRDETIECQARLFRSVAKLLQLAAGFVEMSAESLQILLHEFRRLGKNHGAEDAKRPVQQSLAGAEHLLNRIHAIEIGSRAAAMQAGCDTDRLRTLDLRLVKRGWLPSRAPLNAGG